MTTQETPLPPPLPALPIAYLDDAETSRPWARFVRVVAAIGLVASSMSLAQAVLTFMPLFGLPTLMPTGIRYTVPRLLMALPAILLLAGSITCLSLRPVGQRLMVVYAVAALVMVVFNVGFNAIDMVGRGVFRGTGGTTGYVLFTLLSAGSAAAFPAAVLALMRQPAVGRVFQGR